MKKKLAIVGAGEMALQVMHYAQIDGRYEIVGFFVDYPEDIIELNGKRIIGKISDIEKFYCTQLFDCLFIAIGYKHLRFKMNLYSKLKEKVPFATIIASPAYIDSTATIGNDVLIYPGVIIDRNVKIEDNVLINVGATISHGSFIGDCSFIGVRVAISGFCNIGKCCFLGTNSTFIDNITLCDDIIIGSSALVCESIMESGTYIGVPSKKLR